MGGERINKRRFLSDDHARVPFSIIGVFIILGSSFAALTISRLEVQKSQEIARSLDFEEIEQLLYCLETDLSTALNLAGMNGLKEVGKNPVVNPVIGTVDMINEIRVKEIIKNELNVYLTGHYLYNMYSDGRYAINVVLQNESPILSRRNITLEPLPMQLKRNMLPSIGPLELTNHSTYWVASVPLTLEIRTLQGDTWELVTTRSIVITSLITSRYPLLDSLVKEYAQVINGTFSSLWTYSTVLSNLYSLVRGVKHYHSGRPLNIVDNHHLSVIVNSGLLLEQGLIFGSVDPLGLVELARNVKQVLRQKPQDPLSTFNEEMEGDGYLTDTENLTTGSANVDAGSPINTTIDQSPLVNLSEIAERVLYNITSVVLHFENEQGASGEELIVFEGDIQRKLNEVLQRWANQSFFVTKISKHLDVNATTLHTLQTILAQIYLDTMSTKVADRRTVQEIWDDPGDGWIDGGSGLWEASSIIPLLKQDVKPPKGQVTPTCVLYTEQYHVTYERNHSWWRMEERIINGSIVEMKVWKNCSDTLLEAVTLQVILQHFTAYQGFQDDIVDVLYWNETLDDINLEDTLSVYLGIYPDSNQTKQGLIITRNNGGVSGLDAALPGNHSEWVLEEACSSLDGILGSIRTIALDPSINTTTYPNPVVLFEKAKEDLETKYNERIPEYLNFVLYHPDDEFCSVGKKAVYCIREWYVKEVKNEIESVFSQVSARLADAIDAAIPSDAGFTSQNLTETLDDTTDALRNQFTIPFGYDMNLTRFDCNGVRLWNETVRLAVDQHPNFLDPFETTSWGNEELWTLKIRNRCLFSPTGLPILPPTPVTPWVVTMNLWVIDVQGEYAQFKVIDTSDETIFNPLLGHEPQTYVREMKIISFSNTTLGENTRLSFRFTTVASAIVPPWGMMVGDVTENWFDEHTPGFHQDG